MGPYALIPEESLWALIPMAVYIVVSFMPKSNGLTSAFVACAAGFFLTGQTPTMFGKLVTESLGSTLGLIGLIIMMGAGLGTLMTEAGISHTMVYWIIQKIGVKTEKRAIVTVILTTTLVCGLLGTLAGGCAIIAPILIPVVAAAGLKPATVGAVFQSSGETGLIWGPFTGPTVALLAITGLSYGRMMLWAALPYGIIWLVVIYFVALKIQKDPKYDEVYRLEENVAEIVITPEQKRTTIAFVITFIALVIYSMFTKPGTAYTVFVVIILMLVIGLFSKKGLSDCFKQVSKGMGSMAGIFLLFILLNIMLNYVNYGGGFEALGKLFLSMIGEGSRSLVVIFGTLVGSFGVNGGAVAQLQVTHDLFSAALESTKVPMEVWALALICGSRVTTSIYPGSNMLAPMGLARSESLKAMLLGGWAVSIASIVFIILWALIGMPIFFPV
ncbi:GntT/GntP/DsdX family permease [Oscillospiraceae bacterium LTW-04]|nr:TRAP transporter large permease subunit [Oscillospiraceae bacterium MB24-C1]